MNKPLDSFLEYVIEVLSPFCKVSTRKMFGCYALYTRGKVFAFVIDQQLYFRAGTPRAAEFFESHKSVQFSYQKDGKCVAMCYWKVSADVFEDPGCLEEWLEMAFEE